MKIILDSFIDIAVEFAKFTPWLRDVLSVDEPPPPNPSYDTKSFR